MLHTGKLVFPNMSTQHRRTLSPTSSSLQGSFNPGSGTADSGSGSAEQVFCGQCFKLQTNCGVQSACPPTLEAATQSMLIDGILFRPSCTLHVKFYTTGLQDFENQNSSCPAGCRVHDRLYVVFIGISDT